MSTNGLRRLHLPPRTIRVRLTLIYGCLFLCSGATLLAITYALLSHQYTSSFFISSGKAAAGSKIGSAPFPGPALKLLQHRLGTFVPVGPRAFAADPKIVLAAAQGQSDAARNQLLVNSAIALAIMALLSIWLGWLMAGRALRPLRTITNAAREISASNLHRRLALKGPDDELKQLGTTFDGLLARLEASFEAQRQFVANASHELRTPLTLERTLLELALSDPNASIDSYRHTCEQLLAVGEQQEKLIEALLTLSRSQRGLNGRQLIDLAAVAANAAAAVDHDALTFEQHLRPAATTGDPRLVDRLVANLLSNAVGHNAPGGRVEVVTDTSGSQAWVTVTNTGPTVPPGEIERIFQPFQRLDEARAVDAHGLGLGLSIVKAIAEAHNATISTRPGPDGGLEIEIGFPAATTDGA